MSNHFDNEDEFLRMAEECGVDCFKRPLKSEIIALCKKVQDKQREKIGACYADKPHLTGYDISLAIRKGE